MFGSTESQNYSRPFFSAQSTLLTAFRAFLWSLQIIDLKRDPHGTLDKRGKPTIKTVGNAPRNKTPLQTMEDKLRIANRVNLKYKELMEELDGNIKQTMDELGTDEASVAVFLEQKQAEIDSVQTNNLPKLPVSTASSSANKSKSISVFSKPDFGRVT